MLHMLSQGNGLMTGWLSAILWEHKPPKSSCLIPNKAKDDLLWWTTRSQASPKSIAGQ